MTQFQPETGFTALAQIEAYWEALRGDRLMPRRSEIDPRGIEAALEHAFIVERIAPGVARIRIAGSHLGELMGMEVRGMPLTAFCRAGSRRMLGDLLEEVFQRPAICQLQLVTREEVQAPEARMVLLPLESDLGDVSRIIGGLVSREIPSEPPQRFDIRDHAIRPILPTPRSYPVPAPLATPPPPAPVPLPGFAAPPQTPYRGRERASRPPYLRLVKSDE
ncbi:PAS domain-containing protein [Sulfitobacter aestuarii]|uniref:PAS domain-containing protein n=1 Tax=Sulfitobacter aestuarii TaxID=2161676 RepID=A0ABW5U024_9RHOB